MTWTPNTTGEPHAFAGILGGVVPFAVEIGNRGPLVDEATTVGEVTLTFGGVLGAVPDECFEECIRFVWVNGKALSAVLVSVPEGWVASNVTATAGWPGTTVLLESPPEFTGLSVVVGFGGALVRRVVALTEWRGEPSSPSVLLPALPGGGGVG